MSGIKIKFKEVCKNCRYRETYLNEDIIYGDNKQHAVSTIIGCEHEEVCILYLKSED